MFWSFTEMLQFYLKFHILLTDLINFAPDPHAILVFITERCPPFPHIQYPMCECIGMRHANTWCHSIHNIFTLATWVKLSLGQATSIIEYAYDFLYYQTLLFFLFGAYSMPIHTVINYLNKDSTVLYSITVLQYCTKELSAGVASRCEAGITHQEL